MENLKLQIISNETIKPSSPTPYYLKNFKLSLLDQLAPSLYMPCVFFYDGKNKDTTKFSHQLKGSLSRCLTKYYPFAGRLVNCATICCNDEGVEFFEARMHGQLLQVLQNPDDQIVCLLFPKKYLWLNKPLQDTSLLGVQVTYFNCGGVAVSLCITHKIADGFSTVTFISDWATTSLGRDVNPEFIATSTIQSTEEVINVKQVEIEESKCVTRRFVFCSSSLARLKTRGTSSGLTNPSRVELVTALLYKTAIVAAKSRSGSLINSSLIQLVNMRTRMIIPFLKNSIGNFAWYFTISPRDDNERTFESLVHQLQKGFNQLCTTIGGNKKFEPWNVEISKSMKDVKELFDDMDVYRCTSMCRAPFYEVDFGYGRPLWLRMASSICKNVFVLMDTRDGSGIEAFVTLVEEDMNIFQHDVELLSFASLKTSPFLLNSQK